MPHVVLKGNVSLREVFKQMKPIIRRDGDVILRTMKKYIESEEKSILAEALVVEKGNNISFLAMVSSREDGIVVRIYPGSNVKKTEGVKGMLAEIAKQLLDNFPNLEVGKTNLQNFL